MITVSSIVSKTYETAVRASFVVEAAEGGGVSGLKTLTGV
jgi:hypothetical protein